MFAVLGNIEDPTGASQECVTKDHKTVMIGHDLTDPELARRARSDAHARHHGRAAR